MERVLLDMDVGVDDALALLYALRNPDIQIEAVTLVSGNVPVETAYANAQLVIEVAGGQRPRTVAMGAERPLVREPVYAGQVHGVDGLGNLFRYVDADGRPRYHLPQAVPQSERAANVLCRVVSENPGEVTVVSTGPMTNLALALRQDRKVLEKARRVIC
ncbi:MAG: nucleoside hydrolase, partial [Armatimonadota bacterium]